MDHTLLEELGSTAFSELLAENTPGVFKPILRNRVRRGMVHMIDTCVRVGENWYWITGIDTDAMPKLALDGELLDDPDDLETYTIPLGAIDEVYR